MADKSIKTVLKLTLLGLLLTVQFQNCSTYNDPSPFDLQAPSLTDIPPDRILLDQANDPAELRDTRVPDAHFTVQLDGVCNVGFEAADHYIEFEVSRLDGGTYTRVLSPSPGCDTTNPNAACIRNSRCEHGRYHVLISGQRSAFCPPTSYYGTQMLLRGQLVIVKGNGEVIRSQNASMERSFVFSKLTSVCGS